jgi:SAM-dependent MidA family methyltransferase
VATISRSLEPLVLIAGDPPSLTADEAVHSEKVAAHIRALMAAEGGWLPFSRFMDAALYAPGLGYYMTGRPIFGAEGDYVTAPELSPLFAACLASALAELLAKTGGDEIVEFGAGSGLLAVMVLIGLARRDALPRRYRIVEVSPVLRDRQRAFFGRFPGVAALRDRVEWLDAPPHDEWRGVALANEVVDALPVERFRVRAGSCEALGVSAGGNGFRWQARPAGATLAEAVKRIQQRLPVPMAEGYVSEWRPGLPAWVEDASASLAKGAMLIIDYGLPRPQYYHASRDGGTLCGFRRHRRVEDALACPGIQDLTAWVDFSALADAANACGMETGGFATQAHFLISVGIERELAALVAGAEERDRLALNHNAATLLLPGEMGERFKVMALTRNSGDALPGFSFRDLSASL